MIIRGRSRVLRRAALGLLLSVTTLVAPFTPIPGNADNFARASQSAYIAHSEDGVVLRAAPEYGGDVLDTLADGTAVTLRTDELDTVFDADGETRWWPVSTDAGEGWVAGFYLEIEGWDDPGAAAGIAVKDESSADEEGSASDGDTSGGDTASEGAGGENWSDTAAALVENSMAEINDTGGVNLRSTPGMTGEAVTTLDYQTVVDLRVDILDTMYADGTRWWPVSVDGQDGWISGDYLSPADAALADAFGDEGTTDDSNGATDGDTLEYFSPNQYVEVLTDDGDGLNVRADGAPDAERIGSFPDRDVIQVMDGPVMDPMGNPWYLMTDGDITGYVIGRYLAIADQLPDPNSDDSEVADLAQRAVPDVPKAGVATGTFQYPVSGFTFTQGYGCSPYWFEPWNSSIGCNFHNGVDLAAPMYTPVDAADGGIVEQSGWCDCGLGYYVKIDHGNGFKTVYGHLAEQPWVGVGEAVTKGEEIAPMGSTGNSTGPHTHFIVEYEGVTYDPLWYMP